MSSRTHRKTVRIDPLRDARWGEFLERQPDSSVFHTAEWLGALQRTYGYEPIVLTTAGEGRPLEDGIAFCRVDSWLTGSRMVSLPFSDHCQPLAGSAEDLEALVAGIQAVAGRRCRYIELRPQRRLEFRTPETASFVKTSEYVFHRIDLRPDLRSLFRSFHKSCIQRKIHRAEREGLTYEAGRSESLVSSFYQLLTITRRRHNLPAQPRRWFRHLVDCLGERVTIRVVSKEQRPVAAMLTLRHKHTLVYKYGGCDARWNHLGGMPLLFWKAFQEGKEQGAEEFDLGRTDAEDSGLATFKERLGARGCKLPYLRRQLRPAYQPLGGERVRVAQHVLAWLPDPVVGMAGSFLYRHMG